jgi:hypothetical protein
MDDNAIVESVSSPPEEGDDGPEPEHTLTEDVIRCVKN